VKALVIGYGSIGARHASLLGELGCRTAVVSARDINHPLTYSDLSKALAEEKPAYVVIANTTNQHYDTLEKLTQYGYCGTVLIEKPVFNHLMEAPANTFKDLFVAYNLRFHPVIQRVKSLLEGEKILSVQAYVGQYLPEWRPTTDYRSSYSASAEHGGGALRDLSHELDYLNWMLGGWQRVIALGGHFSYLEITSDDVFALMLVTPACPIVTLQLNYLDRLTRRFILINTANHTIEADLIKGNVTIDREVESFVTEQNTTYRAMHEAVLMENRDTLCSLDDGLSTLRLIEAAELSAKQGKWIEK
jgi:predicted dehydrogenase